MRSLVMYQVDAFADRAFTGNPAAVLVLDEPLREADMQAIAMENNLAETAFVHRKGKMFSLRWFTPVQEAALCGHATLAAAHVLASEYSVTGEINFVNPQAGTLRVQPNIGGEYTLDLPCLPPEPFGPIPENFRVLFPSGWKATFRNFENLFIELADANTVRTYLPDLPRIAELHPLGLVITAAGGTTHAGEPVDFVSRYFVPGAGIPEDPVTGSTHATLVPYWAERLGRTELKAYQASPRGGSLRCCLAGKRMLLSGHVITFMRATIFLPS